MIKRLQPFDFERSPYERPTGRWICGNAAQGRPCRLGPGSSGRCPTRFACDPTRSGADWVCTRVEAAGGACSQGPDEEGRCCCPVPPCVPSRSLRSRRGMVALWTAALTLAAVVLSFGLDGGRMLLEPGPVVQGHAEVEDCRNCHVAFDGSRGHWVLAAFAPANPTADNRKCIQCHEKGSDAQLPHSLPAADLRARSDAISGREAAVAVPASLALSKQFFGRHDQTTEALACATCHKEHKGALHDMTRVSNQRCQSCHSVTFGSLAEGHPPFDGYPYQRRTRLAFDHQKHFRKNFTDAKVKEVPESCASCHLPDASGRFMLVQTFEQTCATCHSKDIEGEGVSGPKGVAVLSIPGLDVEALADRGRPVGQWPELAQADDLTPFMKLLLGSDPQGAGDLARIAKLDLQDLTDASDAELVAVQHLAWAIKELFFDLTVSSADTMQVRLKGNLDMPLDRVAMGQLLGHIPLDVVQAARREWFPGLKREILRHRKERRAFLAPDPSDTAARALRFAAWQVEGVQVAFPSAAATDRTRLAIDFLRGGRRDEPDSDPAAAARHPIQLAQAEPDLLSDSEDLLQRKALRLDELEQLLEEDAKADNSIFKSVSPAAATARKATPKAPAPPDDSTAAAQPEAPANKAATAAEAPKETPRKAAPLETAAEPAAPRDEPLDPNLNPEVWAKLGGWYRRDETLYYRPTGHRDPFMRTWLDLAAESPGTPAEAFGAQILTLFGDKNTPGKCTKCHSLDRQTDGRLQVNWQPFRPNPRQQKFTVFNHAAHFSMVEKDGCITCHAIDTDAKFAEGFRDFDATRFAANFKSMDHKVCATCHVEDAAGDACVTCHRYHVGEFPIRPVRTLITQVPTGGEASARKDQPPFPELAAGTTKAPPVPSPVPAKPSAVSAPLEVSIAEKTSALARGVAERNDKSLKLTPLSSTETEDSAAIAIQFSAFRTLDAAAQERVRVQGNHGELLSKMEIFVNKVDLAERGTFYRVQARPFSDLEMARKVCARLKDRNQDCLVVQNEK